MFGINILLLIMFWIFLIWDCVFFARFNESFPYTGWKKWAMSLTPGSGFYLKWLSEQK